jgi:hypothetical protein
MVVQAAFVAVRRRCFHYMAQEREATCRNHASANRGYAPSLLRTSLG